MKAALACCTLVTLCVAAPAVAGFEPSPFLDFVPVQTIASGPPYPTAPIQFEVVAFDPAQPDVAIDVEVMNLSFTDARMTIPPDDQLPIALEGSRLPPGDPIGDLPKAYLAVLGIPPDPVMPADTAFDLLVVLDPLGASNPRLSYPPDPYTPDPTRFDVVFDIEVDEGIASHTMRFAINPAQPFLFTDVEVGTPQSPAFAISFHVMHDGSGGAFVPGATLFDVTVTGTFGGLEVEIDIKPGSDPNCFNNDGHGVIPVAILGTETFDVADVDPTTLLLDGLDVRVRGNRYPSCGLEDVNDDGFTDLVCHFEDEPDNWEPGEDTAVLTGALDDGTPFSGADTICIVP